MEGRSGRSEHVPIPGSVPKLKVSRIKQIWLIVQTPGYHYKAITSRADIRNQILSLVDQGFKGG